MLRIMASNENQSIAHVPADYNFIPITDYYCEATILYESGKRKAKR